MDTNTSNSARKIYASYEYPTSQSPRFIVAMSINCVTSFIAICAATLLRVMLVRLNKRLDRGEVVKGAINSVPGEAAGRGFRFVL